jgi:hypothetical protein
MARTNDDKVFALLYVLLKLNTKLCNLILFHQNRLSRKAPSATTLTLALTQTKLLSLGYGVWEMCRRPWRRSAQ